MRSVSSIFYGLLTMVIGAVLIAFHSHGELLTWVVILAGIALIVPCLFTMLSTLSASRRRRRAGTDSFSLRLTTTGVMITGFIGIGLGIWLVAAPDFFIRFLAYAFAVLLILYGIYHFCIATWLCGPKRLSAGYYFIPMLLIIAGVVILFTSVRQIKSAVILITGIGLIFSGVSSFCEYLASRRLLTQAESASRPDQPAD